MKSLLFIFLSSITLPLFAQCQSSWFEPQTVTRSGLVYTQKINFSPFAFRRIATVSGTAPDVPTLSSPSDNETSVSLTPILDWNDVSGATTYSVLLDDAGTSFASPIVNVTGLGSSTYTVPTDLIDGADYEWKVRATNSYGTSAYSSTFTFTTLIVPPNAPVLTSPANNSTGLNHVLGISFQWTDEGGNPYSWEIEIYTDIGLTTMLYSNAGVYDIVVFVDALEAGFTPSTPYWWRVRAMNDGGYGTWSSTFKFTTAP